MKEKRKTNLIISIIFILIIFLPLALQSFPQLILAFQVEEKRNLSEKPIFSLNTISTFPERAENYFNDNFLFRNFFINLNSKLRLNIFNSSSSPKVLIGKDGWLFYNGEEANDGATISNHLGLLPYGYDNLFRSYKISLEQKQHFLSKMGIEYLFVIAPDKMSIYPEYLPNGYSNENRKSTTDLLIEYLKNNSNINILDLRNPLIKNKRTDRPLYYKNDTHWNNFGGYFAYKYISSYVSGFYPSIKTRNLDDFSIHKTNIDIAKDLGGMLALNRYDDIEYILTPKTPYSYLHISGAENQRTPQIYFKNASNLPNAIVFRDSFMEAVEPYLSDDFNYIVYLWNQWRTIEDIEWWIEKVKPSFVIEERAERYLLPGVIF